jgi:hypothetical protein
MRRADFQPGESIERPFENQVSESEGRFERIPERHAESAIAAQAAAEGAGRRSLRMNENNRAEFLRFRPERMKLRVGEFLAGDAAADGGAAQPVSLHRTLELLRGEIGELKGDGRKRREPIGMRRNEFGEGVVLNVDDLRREVAIDGVPVGIDAQHGDVDPVRVHVHQPIGERLAIEAQCPGVHLLSEKFCGSRNGAMCVDVDGPNSPAVDHDWLMFRRR